MNDFKQLNLNTTLLKSISLLGYETPSEIQEKVIPRVLLGKDILAKSQTGSGKTASFAIPIIENVDVEENAVQALVLTPTRELAVQVQEDFSTLGLYKRIKAVSLYGKQPMSVQKAQLSQRVHVIVGTPGRTMDHIEKGTLKIDKIKYLIIDEADEMLNMGFIDQVEAIINKMPKERQTLMFSATIPEEIKVITEKYMINPETVEVQSDNLTVDTVEQGYYSVEENKKFDLLQDVIATNNINQCILFCRTKKNVSYLASRMRKETHSVVEIHGDMEQKDRLKALRDFKEGKFTFIVATDIAARGIDVSGVTHVINYDIPLELDSYVHRIGRTGRAGKSGVALTFVTPSENKFLLAIEEFINLKIPKLLPPTKEEVQSFSKEILKPTVKVIPIKSEVVKLYINGGKKKKVRRGDIVGALIHTYEVPGDSIGVIDVFDNYSHVSILNGQHKEILKNKNINIKGKSFKLQRAKED